MRPFLYSGPASGDRVLASIGDRRRPLAGGTDLIPLMKSGRESVDALVDIKRASLPRGVETTGEGVCIGALTTLAEIETSAVLAERYPALVQAARTVATRQIRNRATLGGNLLQRPRCAYFRDPETRCWLSGGDACLAVDGYNGRHAVFGESPCRAVHPSDPAGALLALDAVATLRSHRGERRLGLAELFALPESSRRTETIIAADELLLHIDIPRPAEDSRSVYLKIMDRQTWAFGLVGLALAIRGTDGAFHDARVVFTGFAPIPWRHRACEDALQERAAAGSDRDHTISRAVAAVGEGAEPLSDNRYKIELGQRLLRRALDPAYEA